MHAALLENLMYFSDIGVFVSTLSSQSSKIHQAGGISDDNFGDLHKACKNHKVQHADANYGTTGTVDARCSDRQGRTCFDGPMHRLRGLYQILLV